MQLSICNCFWCRNRPESIREKGGHLDRYSTRSFIMQKYLYADQSIRPVNLKLRKTWRRWLKNVKILMEYYCRLLPSKRFFLIEESVPSVYNHFSVKENTWYTSNSQFIFHFSVPSMYFGINNQLILSFFLFILIQMLTMSVW